MLRLCIAGVRHGEGERKVKCIDMEDASGPEKSGNHGTEQGRHYLPKWDRVTVDKQSMGVRDQEHP